MIWLVVTLIGGVTLSYFPLLRLIDSITKKNGNRAILELFAVISLFWLTVSVREKTFAVGE